MMWFGPLKRFQKLFFHTPLVNVFILGSEAYHDYYRWPFATAASSTSGARQRPGASCSCDTRRRDRSGRRQFTNRPSSTMRQNAMWADASRTAAIVVRRGSCAHTQASA